MDTTARSTSPIRWDLIRWELCWIPIEMAGVALGLGLLLGLGFDNWGNFVLFGVVALSCIVRFQHYNMVSKSPEHAKPAAAPDRQLTLDPGATNNNATPSDRRSPG